MNQGRLSRTPRRHAFFACEGQSELGYVRWLRRLAHHSGLTHVAFNEICVRGGDPLEAVKTALSELKQLKPARLNIVWRGILLDGDTFGMNHQRDREAQNLARGNKLTLLVQQPCHEAFLLSHFTAYAERQPATNDRALKLLTKTWPSYIKGMDALGYEKFLTTEHLRQARTVWPEFDSVFQALRWP